LHPAARPNASDLPAVFFAVEPSTAAAEVGGMRALVVGRGQDFLVGAAASMSTVGALPGDIGGVSRSGRSAGGLCGGPDVAGGSAAVDFPAPQPSVAAVEVGGMRVLAVAQSRSDTSVLSQLFPDRGRVT
jgi:hypothetical protein